MVSGSASAQLEVWLARVQLDDAAEVSAAIARALAAKLDSVKDDDSGAAAIAISPIAKELRAVIDEIRDSSGDRQEFVSDLFS
jgi:hypothetical protein